MGLLGCRPWQSSVARPLAYSIETPRSTQIIGSNDGRLDGGGLALRMVLANSLARNTLVIVTVWATEPDALRGLTVTRVVAAAAERAVAILQHGHVNRSIRIANAGTLAASGRQLVAEALKPRRAFHQPLLRQSKTRSVVTGANGGGLAAERSGEDTQAPRLLVRSSQFPGLPRSSAATSPRRPIVDALGRVLFEAGKRDERPQAATTAWNGASAVPIAAASSASSRGTIAATDSLGVFRAGMSGGSGAVQVDDAALTSFWSAIPDSPVDTAQAWRDLPSWGGARPGASAAAAIRAGTRLPQSFAHSSEPHAGLQSGCALEAKSERASPIMTAYPHESRLQPPRRAREVPALHLGGADGDPGPTASCADDGWSRSASALRLPPRGRRGLASSGRAALSGRREAACAPADRRPRPRRARHPPLPDLALSSSTLGASIPQSAAPRPASGSGSAGQATGKSPGRRELRVRADAAGSSEGVHTVTVAGSPPPAHGWAREEVVQGWAAGESGLGPKGVMLGEAAPYPQWRVTPGGALKTTLIDSSCVMWPRCNE